jgi:hypothetical protein
MNVHVPQGEVSKRIGCDDLDPEWPAPGGGVRGPRLCVLYPNCECGEKDARAKRTDQIMDEWKVGRLAP